VKGRRIVVLAAAAAIAAAASGCGDDAASSTDFTELDVDTGPSADLAESVGWFNVSIELGDAAARGAEEFRSPRCSQADLPESHEDEGRQSPPRNYAETITDDTATVSYDLELLDFDAAREDPTATEVPMARVIEVRDQAWRLIDGRWLWDDC